MVPKLFGRGRSFKKLAAYLLHDPDKANTAERVEWVHMLNLAADTPALAVDEMLWTARAANELKRQAGARTSGRQSDRPVKHFTLAWHPSETPSKDDMIKAVVSYLEHMGWNQHQAIIVGHNDKRHSHLHVMLNAVHPETGRTLVESYEKRWTQRWAEQYEREHGKIFCEERLKPVSERAKSATRDLWEQQKRAEYVAVRHEYASIVKEFDYFKRGDTTLRNSKEWKLLKAAQRKERESYFLQGREVFKSARNEAYRAVKAEYRPQWKKYFKAQKITRGEANRKVLVDWKKDLIAKQRAALKQKQEQLFRDVLKIRKHEYGLVLRKQVLERDGLKQRQAGGERSYGLLDAPRATSELQRTYELAKQEVGDRQERSKETRAPKPNYKRQVSARTPWPVPRPRPARRESSAAPDEVIRKAQQAADAREQQVEKLLQQWGETRGRTRSRD